MSKYDAEPSAASAPARSPWPRAPLSGACSFAHSNALLCAVYEEEALSEKDLLKHLDSKADGKKVAKVEKEEKEAVVSKEAGETDEVLGEPCSSKSFFFQGIPGQGTLLFKVAKTVSSPPSAVACLSR